MSDAENGDQASPDGPNVEASASKTLPDRITKERADTIDLTGELNIDITDALSEKDCVKFTVHTKTTLKEFSKSEVSVTRTHDEFIWLHDVLQETESYAGFIIPPAPPRPNFDASREKLHRLGENEQTMTKEEFAKLKKELEAEYLATFKKTVALHETFLQRLAKQARFRSDHNFRVFLEYEEDLSVRGRNIKERLGNMFKSMSKSVDEVLLSGQKDVDNYFDSQRTQVIDYHERIKDVSLKAERMARQHKNVADSLIKINSALEALGTIEKDNDLHKIYVTSADMFEKARKIEARSATDTDLKIADTMHYYAREAQAAKNLLHRRLRCLSNYEAANKNLERARAKNRDVPQAEAAQSEACDQFEKLSETAKVELKDLKAVRDDALKKRMKEMADLQIKHGKSYCQLLATTQKSLRLAPTE